MRDTEETIEHAGLKIEIWPELEAEDPRDWDNASIMHCEHRRYHLGDRDSKGKCRDYDILDGVEPDEQEQVLIKAKAEYMKLYLYNHSGITISCSPFSCPWDSGQVGFIYVLPKNGKEEWGRIWRKKARGCMNAETETYDMYLRGDCHGYSVVDKDGEVLDSCGGYLGGDHCVLDAKNSAEYWAKEMKKERETKLKELITHHVPLDKRAVLIA